MVENKSIDSEKFALEAARIAVECNGMDVQVIDLRGVSPATDFFVIATGTSDRQRRTIADDVAAFAKKNGMHRFGLAGYEHARWILVDFVDVVLHIFDAEYREFYELETLWGDAQEVQLPEFEKPHNPHAQ